MEGDKARGILAKVSDRGAGGRVQNFDSLSRLQNSDRQGEAVAQVGLCKVFRAARKPVDDADGALRVFLALIQKAVYYLPVIDAGGLDVASMIRPGGIGLNALFGAILMDNLQLCDRSGNGAEVVRLI